MLWLRAKDVELPRGENKRQQQNREAGHVKSPQYPVSEGLKAYHSMYAAQWRCIPVRQEGRFFLKK